MQPQPYNWTSPIGGKTIKWQPLKVGDRMSLDANYSRPDTVWRRKYAEYALRIISCAGVEGKFQIENFQEWDEFDL